MIERKIVDEKMQEFLVEDYIRQTLSRVGHSKTQMQKTPLGEKIIIHASRPGLIVGSKGANIKKLTKVLKTKFKLENPQIEITEVKDIYTNSQLIAENIAYQMERYGSQRFKGIGYSAMEAAIRNGAAGIEILISGKLPSSRARTWRFYMGYLKKCGDLATTGVDIAYTQAKLKTGVVGIQVRVMPKTLVLPDKIQILIEDAQTQEPADVQVAKKEAQQLEKQAQESVSEALDKDEKKTEKKPASKKTATKKATKKAAKTTKKTTKKTAKVTTKTAVKEETSKDSTDSAKPEQKTQEKGDTQ
ncbi:MAG: 30S ribosomal protein S3 [Candidatus Woesearchaeota archaeon]